MQMIVPGPHRTSPRCASAWTFFWLCFLAPHACGQFSTTINVPPDSPPEQVGSDTQVNVLAEGSLPVLFRAGSADGSSANIEVNILGGSVDDKFNAYHGSTVNLNSGTIGVDFHALTGSNVFISDGHVGDRFDVAGGTVTVSGGTVGNSFRVFDGGRATIDGGAVYSRTRVFSGSELSINGGSAGTDVEAFAGSSVRLSGGSISTNFNAYDGSEVFISGGSIGPQFTAHGGSRVELSGGNIGRGFQARLESAVRIIGGEFYLDGLRIAGLTNTGDSLAVNLPFRSVLSGVLADGMPFAFSSRSADNIVDGVLTLELVDLPIDSSTITASIDLIPIGIRRGQTLLVDDGGVVPGNFRAGRDTFVRVETGGIVGRDFEAAGAEVTVSGGQIGHNSTALAGSTVNVSAGVIKDSFQAFNSAVTITGGEIGNNFRSSDSTVTVSGGSIGAGFFATDGSEVFVTGGFIDGGFAASHGSRVEIQGGLVGSPFTVQEGSQAVIRGGVIDRGFRAESGSKVTMIGGDFLLNGLPIGGLDGPGDRVVLDLPPESVLSGAFADGTAFAFSRHYDSLAAGEITLERADLPPVNTGPIVASVDDIPAGLRQGQTLVVDNGSSIGDRFSAGWGSTIQLHAGGSIGARLESVGAEIHVAGVIGNAFTALLNSTVSVTDGEIENDFLASDSTVTVSGGKIGGAFQSVDGTQVTIDGGAIGDYFQARESTVHLTDGAIGRFFSARHGSSVVISGGSIGWGFQANNSSVSITGGQIGPFFSIENASDVTLAGGSIANGIQAFSGSKLSIAGGEYRLNGQIIAGLETPGSRVTVELTPDAILNGTLADGTPFLFSEQTGDSLSSAELTLEATALPPNELTTITASVDTIPMALREGQTLVVDNGSIVPSAFRAVWGTQVIVEAGGSVDRAMDAFGASVTVAGGTVGREFDALRGTSVNLESGRIGEYFYVENSTVTMTGGSIGEGFVVRGESRVIIEGGFVADTRIQEGGVLTLFDGSIGRFYARDGAYVEIHGGTVGRLFRAYGGSHVTIAGGTIGDAFRADGGSNVIISGGSLGQAFVVRSGSNVTVSGGSIGDLFQAENGSQLTIAGGSFGEAFRADRTSNVNLKGSDFRIDGVLIAGLDNEGDQTVLDQAGVLSGILADGTPFVFAREDNDTFPARSFVLESAVIPPIGPELIVASTDVVPLGIRAGQTLRADRGSVIADNFNAGRGSTVQVDPGAVVGRNIEASGAEIIVSGGAVGDGLDAFHGSVVTISGGTLGNAFSAYADSEIHLLGTEFTFDGLPIDGLVGRGDSIVLEQRDAPLAGRFLDGNLFHFELNSALMLPEDYFHPEATVRLTLGNPLPRDCDFDDSGDCELADIDQLMAALGSADAGYDLDGNGEVDGDDVKAWLASAGQKSVGRPFSAGDATLDGKVDQADLNVVGVHWLSAASGWSSGDFNGDGQVNAIDLDTVGQNWLATAAAPRSVPEPAAFALAVYGWLLLLRQVRAHR